MDTHEQTKPDPEPKPAEETKPEDKPTKPRRRLRPMDMLAILAILD